MQLAQDPSVDQLNPRVPESELQKLGGASCFCGVSRLFGVQLAQDPSVYQLNRLVTSTRKAETWMCRMLLRCEPPVWRAIGTGSMTDYISMNPY